MSTMEINENGKLKTEIIRINAEYQLLDKQSKIEILSLLKDWLDIEVIKIQFED